MAYTVSAVINVLPTIGNAIQVYATAINTSTNALTEPTITAMKLLYGNANIMGSIFVPYDANPIAIQVNITEDSQTYVDILYINAVYAQSIPDNFARLCQKIPLGIFKSFAPETNIYACVKAKALMIDDYYTQYFDVVNQIYSNAYSTQLEEQYNGTIGLLSNSYDPISLFHLFSSLKIYGLNAYDLELLFSQYIYFRLGIECPVYAVNDASPLMDYWILGKEGFTQFGQNPAQTILAPDDYNPVLANLEWTIFNSGAFTAEFQTELTNFIARMSRADIGNPVIFSSIVNPVDVGFTLIGPTYKNDPRLIYGKCIKYIDVSNFPLNIIGYKSPT